jgi:hypothetical protein
MVRRLLIVSILAVAGTVLAMSWTRPPGQPFDADAWQRADTRASNTIREQMGDRLIFDKTLLGKTRNEIVSVLGQPLEKGYGPSGDWDLIYMLGLERNWAPIDNEYLVIRLDPSGRATHCQLTTD